MSCFTLSIVDERFVHVETIMKERNQPFILKLWQCLLKKNQVIPNGKRRRYYVRSNQVVSIKWYSMVRSNQVLAELFTVKRFWVAYVYTKYPLLTYERHTDSYFHP